MSVDSSFLDRLSDKQKSLENRISDKGPIDKGGGPPQDGDMEDRVKKLEESIVNLVSDVGAMKSNYATKADIQAVETSIQKSANETIKWVVGTAIVIAVGAITIMTFVLNNAIPKATSVAAAAPPSVIINNIPPAPAVSPSSQVQPAKRK